MKTKTIALFVFLCLIQFYSGDAARVQRHFFSHTRGDTAMDVTDFSIFYDLKTNSTIRRMMPRPWYKPGWRLRLPFMGGNCNCDGLKCSCCSGIRIPAFNFDRQTCANLTFDPTENLVDMEVFMNNNSVFHRAYSVTNPPSLCVPIPVPYLPPGLMDLCVRLFDITVDYNKMHVCMDWDTRIDTAPVLILHFDCMDMGLGGVSLTKPGSNQTSTVNPMGSAQTEQQQLDSDVYDPVSEDPNVTDPPNLFTNSVKYI